MLVFVTPPDVRRSFKSPPDFACDGKAWHTDRGPPRDSSLLNGMKKAVIGLSAARAHVSGRRQMTADAAAPTHPCSVKAVRAAFDRACAVPGDVRHAHAWSSRTRLASRTDS